MKNIGNMFVRLFVVSLLPFSHFSTIVSLFGAGAAPFFTAPGSGSEQTVSAAPAPAKMCRLRLRIPDINLCYFAPKRGFLGSKNPKISGFLTTTVSCLSTDFDGKDFDFGSYQEVETS